MHVWYRQEATHLTSDLTLVQIQDICIINRTRYAHVMSFTKHIVVQIKNITDYIY